MNRACTHKDVTRAFTIAGCEIWGGRETEVMKRAGEFDVIISLLGKVRAAETNVRIAKGSRRTFASVSAYQQRKNNILCIDWMDMSAPKLDRNFWVALAEDLSRMKGKAAIFCMGGHGRTGTALCSLMQVTGFAPAIQSGDLVEWLRSNYCAHAVETCSQVEYLRNVMGVVTPPFPMPRMVEDYAPRDSHSRGFSKYFQTKVDPDFEPLEQE